MTFIQFNRTREESVRIVNTHNGFYVPQYEWEYLKSQKWNIVAGENNEGNFVGWGEFYNGDPGIRYLYAHNKENDAMKFQVEKHTTSSPAPTRWKLRAAATATALSSTHRPPTASTRLKSRPATTKAATSGRKP